MYILCISAKIKSLSLLFAGEVAIWDFELGRLLGKCDQAAAVTAIKFVEPYPAALVSDAHGTMQLWSTPPSEQSFACLAAWQAYSPIAGVDEPRYGSILCFCLSTHFCADQRRCVDSAVEGVFPSSSRSSSTEDPDDTSSTTTYLENDSIDSPHDSKGTRELARILFIAGDDVGYVTLWDILPLMSCLEMKCPNFSRVHDRVICKNPRLNVRVDAKPKSQDSDSSGLRPHSVCISDTNSTNCGTEHSENAAEVAKSQKTRPEDEDPQVLTNVRIVRTHELRSDGQKSLIKVLTSFAAHTEAIMSLQYVDASSTIITSGLDRVVRLWSEAGTCLGSLRQGRRADSLSYHDAVKHEPWLFRGGDARQKQRSAEAAEALKYLRDSERDQRAAQAAAADAKPCSSASNTRQLRRLSDGQLHFVLNHAQLVDMSCEKHTSEKLSQVEHEAHLIETQTSAHKHTDHHHGSDDEDACDSTSRMGNSIMSISTSINLHEKYQPRPPLDSSRRSGRRTKPIGPATAGRRIYSKGPRGQSESG